jgi:DNA-binding response OmpR family regulator
MRDLVLMLGCRRGRFACWGGHLQAGGFGIMTANDAREAVRLVGAVRPALGVIDLSTLEGTGWEICEAIRAIPSFRSMPLLVITDATGAPRRVVKARARHLDCTLFPRTLKQDELVDFVAAVIGLSQRPDHRSKTSINRAESVLEEPRTEDN